VREISVTGASGTSRLMLGASISDLREFCGTEKAIIVTDRVVHELHGRSFPPWPVVEIGIGEISKVGQTVEVLYGAFLEAGLDRSSMVIGIGGGIVCDVAGFAAATYLRGVSFGFVPTTLLAQVDAAVGGKNGINFMGYKNMIGTFSQPRFVLCDHDFLATLPQEELRNGFAEVIKQAAIGDGELFAYIEKESSKALSLDREVIEEIVGASLAVKVRIVIADEREKGERRKLNFGHTLGHALEMTAHIRHGEAISIGMVAAARLSHRSGMLDSDGMDRIERLIERFGLPRRIAMNMDMVIDAMEKDKKREGNQIHFVLLRNIGSAEVVPVDIDELREVLNDLCEYR
jgi:3-dehydroquinate synthase